MRKTRLSPFVVTLFLICSYPAISQDCDALIGQRAVPGTNSFIYTTTHYIMYTQQGLVKVNALTADSAVAVVFVLGDVHQTCVDEGAKIYIRFSDGEELEMANAAGANCESKSAIFFSKALGNMDRLQVFLEKKIRYVKIWMSAGWRLRVDIEDKMAYNIKKSINCLVNLIGAPAPSAQDLIYQPDSTGIPENFSPPEFAGGEKALLTFFARNMRHVGMFDKGTVILSFVVSKDGDVSDINVVLGVSEPVDNEARRLVSILPRWKPAFKNGRAVSASVRVRIPF